ncbi:MAG TPA: Gfo/Idh/MocA family oxidoreductase [Bacteroides sp.]|nr:Gfo/Idh/MocA family oxidoreductase [Bacteroides sp.]
MYSKQISRRRFVRNAALAAAATGLRSRTLAMPGILTGKQKKVGVALVGLGYYSTDLLAPALQETKTAYLAGIVTGTPAKEKIWMEKYGIPRENVYNYENFDEMSTNPDIGIVYVVLPNSMHKEYTIRAARAGKHVICEKPMALNAQECREMITACEEYGVTLSIGYRMQFEPHTQEVMRLGQERVFGQVLHISCGAGFRNGGSGHWKLRRDMGGGAMMDMGVYPLQAARYVTGEEPVIVNARSCVTRPEIFTDVEEAMMFDLQFPSGCTASLSTGFHAEFNFLKVFAEEGWFGLDPFSSYRGIKGKTSRGPLEFPQINQQAAQMDEVAECILSGKPMRVPGEEGLRDMIVVDRIYSCAEKVNC